MNKVISLTCLLLSCLLFASAMVVAQTGGASKNIQSQDTEFGGVVAELTECKRKEGVLTVKVQFHNTSDASVNLNIDTHHGDYEGFYVTANDKKYFILKDSEKAPLAPKYINSNLAKDEKSLWWAKFPAPPPEVKKINLVIPKVMPFEDVPITD